MRPKSLKLHFFVTSLSFEAPLPRNPHEHARVNLIRLNVEFVDYIFAADIIGSSFFEFPWSAPKDA